MIATKKLELHSFLVFTSLVSLMFVTHTHTGMSTKAILMHVMEA